MSRKIAFFDIDGTLTSEIDGSVPADAASAIRQARNNGHLMFINTGRCMQNVEERFREVGFDGYCCGCGTNIYCTKDNTLQEILYVQQNHSIVAEILDEARKYVLIWFIPHLHKEASNSIMPLLPDIMICHITRILLTLHVINS